MRYCANCGDRIGVYEPLWLEQPDGTLLRTSVLNMNEHQHDGYQPRLFHLGCLATNEPSAARLRG